MDRAEIERLLMKPTQRKRLGKYVLLGRLGHGGMGKIYLAYSPGPAGIEKLLVIKRLHSHLTSDPVLVSNFLDEARLSMVLNHPNIVHTYDVGEVDGRYFMVMEYIEGQNLGVVLRTAKRSGSYPDGVLWAGLFLGVLDALHYAHTAHDARGRALNIIHRDVSPQNVLVTYDGTPRLVDFGIAKAAMRMTETDAGVLKGKYAYMSPEQCQGDPLDARSDVFSAGIVLWEMLAGRRLYKAESVVKSVDRILHEAPIPPTKVNAECDPELSKVVVKALQKRPEDRFPTADAFRCALDEAIHKTGKHFRSGEVRALMGQLFADVRERQRAILEACLSGNLEGDVDREPASDEGDSPGSGSESDLRVPDLDLHGGVEFTTPSTYGCSPLVTQEGEKTRSRPASSQRPVSVVEVAPANAVVAVEIPRSAQAAPLERPHARAFRVAAIGVLVLCGGLALALGLGVFSKRDGERAAEEERIAATLAPERESRAEGPEGPSPAPEPSGEGADGEGAAEGEAEPAEDARLAEPEAEAPNESARTPKSKSDRRIRKAAGKAATKERATAPEEERKVASAAAQKPEPQVLETGLLTLQTVPWTVVYLDGKRLGETPLVNVRVPAGELELLLVNEQRGIRQRYFLKVEPGKAYRRRLALE